MRASHALLLAAAGELILAAPAVITTIPHHSSSAPLSLRPRGRLLHAHAKRVAYAVKANEVVDGQTACRAVTVVYARGTTQDGNIGAAGDVGPEFVNALAALVGPENLAVQGVEYDADVTGFLGHLAGTDDEGVENMARLVDQVSSVSLSVSICVRN